MFNMDFWKMVLSGFIYSAITIILFGVWLQYKMNSLKVTADKSKVQNLLQEELNNFYELLGKLADDTALISLNVYCWEHIDQKIIFEVFSERELKIYFKLYNHLDDIKKICYEIKESQFGVSSALSGRENIRNFYLREFNRNKKEFLGFYNKQFIKK